MADDVIRGDRVTLRPATEADTEAIVAIRSTPEVWRRWRGDDVEADHLEALARESLHYLVIEDETGATIGAIQWEAEEDPDYRQASIDVFVDPAVHGRGIGTDAVRTLAAHLVDVEGHHRLTIDPAADNAAAIRCYEKVGFRPIGIMRQYERGPDGTFHDSLYMDLLADELDRRTVRSEDPA